MNTLNTHQIHVTKTFVPPIDEYNRIVSRAFENEWFTNRGELVSELEAKLKLHLGVNQITLHTNGTLPIQIALKALGITKEVITTPFSYVATTSAIVWEGATPIFADIDKQYWTIDPIEIEKKITSSTQAILATHVFGNPCDVERINIIAQKHNLIVIYDAAHSFGVKYKGVSLFNYGDVSTCSFHATKVFHTGEGGATICNHPNYIDKIYYHHNFGHAGLDKFHGLGINSKMSELQAAMGLAVLPYMNYITDQRKAVCDIYESSLKGEDIQFIKWRKELIRNYSYFPIAFRTNGAMKRVKNILERENIYPRRYFYPSLNKLPYIKDKKHMPFSEDLSSRILCLPLSHDLEIENAKHITNIIINNL